MIYFVINNEYQLNDCRLHLDGLRGQRVGLVLIPHRLCAHEVIHDGPTYIYENDFHSGHIAYYRTLRKNRRRMLAEIAPEGVDTVIAYTEQEPLNLFLLDLFRRVGARRYLIEDCGPGTYIPFSAPTHDPLGWKNMFRQALLRCVLGLPGLRLIQINGLLFRWLPDKQLNGVLLYRSVALARKIPTVVIRRPPEPLLAVNPRVALFLNQDVYNDGMVTDEYYLETLRALTRQLAQSFDVVFFKFHPRESAHWKQRIAREAVKGLTNITLVDEVTPVESMVERFRPGVAVSFLSSALFNLAFRGVEPAFIYHLFPSLAQQPYYQVASQVLASMGYQFPRNVEALRPDFQSRITGPCQTELSLSDAIARN